MNHEDEILTDNTKISYCDQCTGCAMWGNGDAFSNSPEKAYCDMFKFPARKPTEVINNTGKCPYRVAK